MSGDLLPHLPVVARALALAGGRGPTSARCCGGSGRGCERNSLALCHVETPLTPARPPATRASTRRPRSPARSRPGFDACSTASNHSLDRGQAGIDADAAGARPPPAFATPARSPRAASAGEPLLLRARGVRVAFLAYTQMTNGIPLPHPWSVNLASAGADPARCPPRAPRRRARRDRQPALGHGVPARAGRVPAGARAEAGTLPRDHRRGRPARPCRTADPPHRPPLGRVRRGQPALEPDRRVLPRGQPGRHAGAPSSSRRAGRAHVERITTRRPGCATPTTPSSARRRARRRGAARSRWSGAARGLRRLATGPEQLRDDRPVPDDDDRGPLRAEQGRIEQLLACHGPRLLGLGRAADRERAERAGVEWTEDVGDPEFTKNLRTLLCWESPPPSGLCERTGTHPDHWADLARADRAAARPPAHARVAPRATASRSSSS